MNVGSQGILHVNVAFALVQEVWEVEDAEAPVLDIVGALAMGVEVTVLEEDLLVAATHLVGNEATAEADLQFVAVAIVDLQSVVVAIVVRQLPMLTGIVGKQGNTL